MIEVEARLRAAVRSVQCPHGSGYLVNLWGRSLSVRLVGVRQEFSDQVLLAWGEGRDWPGWNQIIAAVPEMKDARLSLDLMTGTPGRSIELGEDLNNDQLSDAGGCDRTLKRGGGQAAGQYGLIRCNRSASTLLTCKSEPEG